MSEERPLYGEQQIVEIVNENQYDLIQKIRNYYNAHHNIDGRPPSKKDFNDFLDSLNKDF